MTQLKLRRVIAELGERVAEQEQYERRLEEYQRTLELSYATIAAQSLTDPLTGIPNRRAFTRRLDAECELARREGAAFSVAMFDVDEFKRFNDEFGHGAGDDTLATVAHALRDATRTSDLLARLGGEEFAVLLPGTDEEGAFVIAERMRRAVEREHWTQRRVTVSAGVATLTPNMRRPADLLSAADRALFVAKRAGRNRVAASEHTTRRLAPTNHRT